MEAEATSPESSADEPADGLQTSAMAMAASNSRARARLPDNCEDDRVLARSGPHESDPTAQRVAGVDVI